MAKKKPAPKAPKNNPAPRAVPETNAHLTKTVGDNCPANWKGTKDQFIALYKGCVTGLKEEVERSFAKLFPRMAMDAAKAEAELGKPKADIEFSVTVDFTKLDIVRLSGSATHTTKEKHTVTIGHSEELKQIDFLKDGAPGAAPNGGKPDMKASTTKPEGGKNAPSNKAADTTEAKQKTGETEKAPTPPAVTPPEKAAK